MANIGVDRGAFQQKEWLSFGHVLKSNSLKKDKPETPGFSAIILPRLHKIAIAETLPKDVLVF